MLSYTNLISIDRTLSTPLVRQICDQIVRSIREGIMVPGSQLPATRVLADIIQVNRKTVVKAYEELLSQDWIEALPRQGFRVRPELPVLKPRSFQPASKFDTAARTEQHVAGCEEIPMPLTSTIAENEIIVNDGLPDHRFTPANQLLKEFRKQLKNKTVNRSMYYLDEGGAPSLKKATAAFLNSSRGLNVAERNVVITRGGQMAIFLAISMLVQRGDHVVVTDPNYIFADETFNHAGAVIHKISVDEYGPDISELEDLLSAQKIKMLYIAAHHHHPTTVTMSAERRLKLLDLISRFGFWVVEDDYDYDYHHENKPILPLATSAHSGRIIYTGSFSKLVGPSVRLGYLIASAELVQRAVRLKRLMDLKGDTMLEASVAHLITAGVLERHIRKVNKIYAKRCKLLTDLLKEHCQDRLHFRTPQGGLALWVSFDRSIDLRYLIRKAAGNGVHFLGSICVDPQSDHFNSIRIGFASLDDMEIRKVVKVLSSII